MEESEKRRGEAMSYSLCLCRRVPIALQRLAADNGHLRGACSCLWLVPRLARFPYACVREDFSGFPVFSRAYCYTTVYELCPATCSAAAARSNVLMPAVTMRASVMFIPAGRTRTYRSGMSFLLGMGARPELYDPAGHSP